MRKLARKLAPVLIALLVGLAVGYYLRPPAKVRGPAALGDPLILHHSEPDGEHTERLTIQRIVDTHDKDVPSEYRHLGKIWVVHLNNTLYLATPADATADPQRHR